MNKATVEEQLTIVEATSCVPPQNTMVTLE